MKKVVCLYIFKREKKKEIKRSEKAIFYKYISLYALLLGGY
jgi:hypothetical protein